MNYISGFANADGGTLYIGMDDTEAILLALITQKNCSKNCLTKPCKPLD